jgi:hypothetical protein
MQTTLRIDDALHREAKAEAARQGVTLTRFLEDGLRLRLQKARSTGANVPARIRTYRQGQPFPFNDSQLRDIANREQEAYDISSLNSPNAVGNQTPS